MKTIIIMLALFIAAPICLGSTERPSAYAIEWWLREKGKFIGSDIKTKQLPDESYEIKTWGVNGVAKPTDPELKIIIDDYEVHLVQEKKDKKIRKKAVLQKMGLSVADMKALKELMQDKNLD